MERLKRKGGGPVTGTTASGRTSQKKAASGNNFEEHIAGLIQDRDYWKSQVDLLSQMLACPSVVGLRNVKSQSAITRTGSAGKFSRSKSHRETRHKVR